MNIPDEHVVAIESLGYTADEARFLCVVATHSGYFVPRQFVDFTGAGRGRRSHHFTEKIEKRGHATWREYLDLGGVYHLFSKTIYRLIDRESLRNRQRHSTEFIRTRLLLLDFIIANPRHRYLETEQDKVHFFCEERSIPKKTLPAKAYGGGSAREPTLRYFVDQFPLFLDSSNGSSAPVVTLSYVDPGQASLAGFARHLHHYALLFQRLAQFRFLYIASSGVHFVRAQQRFFSLLKAPLRQTAPEDLEHYFRLRAAWEGKQYGMLSNEDIEYLADERFGGARVEWLYKLWASSDTGNQQWRTLLTEAGAREVEFGTYLVDAHAQQPGRAS
jgi:hypothetical protein